MSAPHRALIALIGCGVFVGTFVRRVVAQQTLYEVRGTDAAHLVDDGAVVGDWNGDGTRDVAVRLPLDSTVAFRAGAVEIRSGTDASLLASLYGSSTDEYFGFPVAMPDVDGDGIDDLLVLHVGARVSGATRGAASLYAGGTGARLWRLDGTTYGMGISGGPIGDFDGDGVRDVFVGEAGALYVVSGASGSIVLSITGKR